MQGSDGTVACRENKAVILQNAIDRTDTISERIQSILNRVRDGDMPIEAANKLMQDSPMPTISRCLIDGPEHLNNTCSQQMGLLDQLEQELF